MDLLELSKKTAKLGLRKLSILDKKNTKEFKFSTKVPREIKAEADLIIDIGPGAGKLGGEIIAQNQPYKLDSKKSITAKYLAKKSKKPITKKSIKIYNVSTQPLLFNE